MCVAAWQPSPKTGQRDLLSRGSAGQQAPDAAPTSLLNRRSPSSPGTAFTPSLSGGAHHQSSSSSAAEPAVAELSLDAISQLRGYRSPPPPVVAVAKAVLLLFGRPLSGESQNG